MTQRPKIVFFGTGPVSLATLVGINQHFDIEAVITKADRAVRSWAEDNAIKVVTVESKGDIDSTITKYNFESRVGLVVDFGIILSEQAINSFELGIINSHYSLLPLWRGADPISATILAGDTETGVSIMQIVAKMDEGDLIAQEKIVLDGTETIISLTDRLVQLSNKMLIEKLPQYLAGKIKPWPQSGEATYSRKLTKADGSIDWAKPATQIEREIRAFLGWPGSYTTVAGRDVIITSAEVIEKSGEAGQAESIDKQLIIYCGEQALKVISIKPAGKREMTASEFLAGNKL